MGREGICRCEDCQYEFRAGDGSTLRVEEWRCEKCDKAYIIGWEEKEKRLAEKPCRVSGCDGMLRTGLSPMCPACGSRKTKFTRITTRFD